MFESFSVDDIRKAREVSHDKIKDLSVAEIIQETRANAANFDKMIKDIQENTLLVK